MDYFVSHIGVISIAACFIGLVAVAWWLLTDWNAKLRKKRTEARLKNAETKQNDE